MRISPHRNETEWHHAIGATPPDWSVAIDIVEDRIVGRWLRWSTELVPSRYAGFAILALDCIVIESLWGFINGKSVPKRQEQQVYRDILCGRRFRWTTTQAEDFRVFIRNGLMHDAETRNHWIVEMTRPATGIIQQDANGEYVLNRTTFHQALVETVEDWLSALRAGDNNLRQNMRDRMNEIIQSHHRP